MNDLLGTLSMGLSPLILLLALLVALILKKGLVVIRQSERMVVERLGRYHRTLMPGINFLFPIIDRPRRIEWKELDEDHLAYYLTKSRIDMRETVYDFPRQNVITKDNVLIEINALLYFQINDPVKAVYEIVNLPEAIEKLTQTTLRNVIGELDLDGTLTSRDTINDRLRKILDQATDRWGVKVNRVELQDITPPPDIRDAMEKQMRAERDKRAKMLEAEGEKRARILEAEGFRESEISRAEGSKQAAILKAEGEAEALRQIFAALKDSGSDPVQYMVALRYINALQQMGEAPGGKTVFVPYEATSVLGSLGAMKELFKNLS